MVKSRRPRSTSIESRERHRRLAGVVAVHLGPERRDLEHPIDPADGPALRPDRPERLALVPHRVGPAPEACPDLVGPGVGGEVEVETVDHGTIAGDEQVADRAADQVQAVPGRGETFGERGQLGQNGREAVRNHGLRGYWRARLGWPRGSGLRRSTWGFRPTRALRSAGALIAVKTAGGGGGSSVGPSILSEERRTLHCGEVSAPFAAAAT